MLNKWQFCFCFMSKYVRRGGFDDQKKVEIHITHICHSSIAWVKYILSFFFFFNPSKPLNLNTHLNSCFCMLCRRTEQAILLQFDIAWLHGRHLDTGQNCEVRDVCNLGFSNRSSLFWAFSLHSCFLFLHSYSSLKMSNAFLSSPILYY